MKFVVIVGLSFGILVENENICLIYAEEWLKPYLLCQCYALFFLVPIMLKIMLAYLM